MIQKEGYSEVILGDGVSGPLTSLLKYPRRSLRLREAYLEPCLLAGSLHHLEGSHGAPAYYAEMTTISEL